MESYQILYLSTFIQKVDKIVKHQVNQAIRKPFK